METQSQPVVLINLFEVPSEADERFVEEWRKSREFLKRQTGYLETALHRSMGPEADFRYVNVARWSSPEDFQRAISQPDFPGQGLPFAAHPSLYRVVRKDEISPDRKPAAVLINAFEVPFGSDEEFLGAWEGTKEILRQHSAYLSTELHQSLTPQADFRFVNIGLYESPQAFQRAIQIPEFAAASRAFPFKPHPGLYGVVESDARAKAA